jgi:flagellar biosynthesis component FlhA
MTPEVQAALVALLLTVLTGLSWFVRYATEQIKRKLDQNTAITKQVEQQTNGQLAAARDEATKWRLTAERQTRILTEQKWLISQLQKREDGRALIDRIMQARRAIVHDGDYASLEQRLLREASKDLK